MHYDPTFLQEARRAQLEHKTIDLAVYCTHLKDVPFGNLRFHPVIMYGDVVGIVVMLSPYGAERYFGATLPVPFYNTELWTTLGMLYGRYQGYLEHARELQEVTV